MVEGLYNISVFTGVGLFTGLKWYKELQIRLYCRHVLLDHWTNRPVKQFWLNLLLRPWPLVSQARLLFILYGPSLPEGKTRHPVSHLFPHWSAEADDVWLLSCSIKLFCFVCKMRYKHLQEPWAGIAWWRWSCPAVLFGMWQMLSTCCLVILAWRTSPISRWWPSWRSSFVTCFISCPRLISVRRRLALFVYLYFPTSYSAAVARGERGPPPGAVWELTVLHHSSQ